MLSPGTRVGSFEILAPLGAGGMGEVYRARDTRLDRSVAIKILASDKDAEAHDQERFEREARAISRLSHPNICTLHDVGSSIVGDTERPFLVMELIDGETLESRLRRGPLTLDEALRYAIQIAEALAAAHGEGVVHRDLKPANIMLTRQGVKLLDFGVAHLRRPAGPVDPTMSVSRSAAVGVVAGTLPYMSPEQLRGESVDERSDMFAFGAVLYEMLTGIRAFPGDSQVEVIASILERDAPALPDNGTGARRRLDRLIQSCLIKSRSDRWQNPHDAALELRGIEQDLALSAADVGGGSRRSVMIWPLIAAAAFAAGFLLRRPPAPAAHEAIPRRLMVNAAPVTGRIFNPVAAPDGRALAFYGAVENVDRIVIRRLDTGESRALAVPPGSSGFGTHWSADGRSLLHAAAGVLYSIDIGTGATRTIAESASVPGLHAGIAQNGGGTILLGGQRLQTLATGDRTPRDVYPHDPGLLGQYWPSFLPNGTDFVFAQASTDPERTGVFLGALGSDHVTRLVPEFSNAHYSPVGYLIFGQGGTLVAQRFNSAMRAVAGQPAVIASDVTQIDGYTHFTLSAGDAIAYVPTQPGRGELVWYTREGKPTGKVGSSFGYRQVVMTSDGQRVFVERVDTADNSLWALDMRRGTMVALNQVRPGASTFRGAMDPTVSRDGGRFAFTAWVDNDADLFIQDEKSAEPTRLVLPGLQWAESFSADGRTLFYVESETADRTSIRAIEIDDPQRSPRVLVAATATNDEPHLSPDGRWLAYASNESGRFEVYVQGIGARSERHRLSLDGGGQPKWRADGREVFFLASDGTLMRVAMPPDGEPGKAEPLFRTSIEPYPLIDQYAVSADGQQFLTIVPIPSRESGRLMVLTNWTALLPK